MIWLSVFLNQKLQIDSSRVLNFKIRIILVYPHRYLYLPSAIAKLIKTITKFYNVIRYHLRD